MPSTARLERRMGRLRKSLRAAGLGGVAIPPGPNLEYYTGVRAQLFERPFLLLVPDEGSPHLVAPRLEAGPFERTVPVGIHAWNDTEGPSASFTEALGEMDRTRGPWGCDGSTPLRFVDHLTRRGMRLEPADQLLQAIRAVKEPSELELIRESASILSASILRVPEAIADGLEERELARFIAEDAMDGGADSVEPMVQSGPRAADPHSETSSRRMRRGEGVVVDVVSSCSGYKSDITRTFVIGSDIQVERTYGRVLAAQRRAMAAARAGVTTGEVDAAAREALTRDGLGRYFVHRTGHGLGLEVHEAPYIVSGGRDVLARGMVFTIEPGAYIPGRLGVRIEDDVAISGGGGAAEVITGKVPTDYGWWRR